MATELTRFTTPEERSNIVGVNLDETQVQGFMDLISKGLANAVQVHDSSVQDDMALNAEVSIRLSRPVRADGGEIEELVGRETVTSRLIARKVYEDPAKKPVVD